MVFSTALSTISLGPGLRFHLEKRIEESLTQEVKEFRQLVKERKLNTSQPSREDVKKIFKVYLSRNIPNDDEFLLTLLNGQFYKSSPRALPELLHKDSDLVKHLAQLTQPERGKKITSDTTLVYLAEPLKIGGKTQGVFVVAHTLDGERAEVAETITTVFEVTLVSLVFASVLAWFAAGRVLAPLHLLTETARSISQRQLYQRRRS